MATSRVLLRCSPCLARLAPSSISSSFSSWSHHAIPSTLTFRQNNFLLTSRRQLVVRGTTSLRLGSKNITDPSCHHQLQLRRNYLYLPTSWTELQLRLQSFQQRTIRVRLKLRATQERLQTKAQRHVEDLQYEAQARVSRLQSNAQERVQRLQNRATERVNMARSRAVTYYKRQRNWMISQRQQLTARNKAYRTLRLDQLRSAEDAFRQRLAIRSNAFRQRVRARTLRLRTDVESLWSQTKTQYNNSRLRKKFALTKHITLKEYSEADWFDSVGRPLTSRDKTGRFVNPWQSQSTAGVHGLSAILRWRWERLKREYAIFGWKVVLPSFWKGIAPETLHSMAAAASLPHLPAVTPSDLLVTAAPSHEIRITWLGHATCLVQKGDITILTDPMFSERASPYQDTPVGIARDVPPIFKAQDLPPIDVCLISHDHYDHLDRDSVLQLKDVVSKWVVPSGIGDWLQDRCDIARQAIVELEWWESVRLQRHKSRKWKVKQLTSVGDSVLHPTRTKTNTAIPDDDSSSSLWLTCCPAQHWASRTFFDRNYRLWCSFAIYFPQGGTFYFGGDSAYPSEFPLFEQISDYIGPIDLAAIPIGAYEPDWFMRDSHMNPREAIRVHQILRARTSLGIHWGTFPLSEEPLGEPSQWLKREAQEAGVNFVTVPHGAALTVDCRRRPEAEDTSSYEWIVE